FVSISLSFFLLNKAIQTIPLGTGYAVWTGIGAVGTAIIGIFIFQEPAFFWRVFFITLLIASIIGLKFVSN
ncbi:MAG TPA: SMR family transporter, partial [Chryseolinea sp.]|nr:SMR family transporter [Chryseolinea sp.]